MRAVIYAGDCLDVLAGLADEFVDAVVTDPPYELGFMGRAWDASGIAYNVDLWKQCLRVLKPGGHLLAFGGTRTSHRLTCAIEDAGFEIRDEIAWLYGCLTADTEILTEHGWKPGIEVTEGECVAQWDSVTSRITLAPVQETFRAPWDGLMRVLRNADTDQILTPNHRVYHQPRQRRVIDGKRVAWYGDEWRVAEAGDLSTWNPVRLPIAGTHSGSGVGGEDYAALLGWVWTEGGFDLSGTGVRIYQSSVNADKVAEIAALMDRLGPHKRYDRDRAWRGRIYTETTWFISGDLAARVRADLPGKRPTYALLWRMTFAEKSALLRAALLGDGSCSAGGTWQFYQQYEDDLVWLQTLLALIGKAGKVGMRPNRSGGAVYLRDRGTTELQARHLRDSTEHYTGEVWCVRVPAGAFVARRNGKVFITGNSGFPKSLDVSKAITATQRHGGANSVKLRQSAMGEEYRPSGKQGNRDGTGGSKMAGDGMMQVDLTDDAKRWAGWGTALKPSHEPVICAMKPHTLQQILATIGSRLGDLEELWRAPAAGQTTPTGAAAGSSGPMVTWPFESAERTSWSTVSSWRNCWADLCSRLSMSITATTSSMTTGLRTLCFLLERITHASITLGQMTADGLRSLVVAADNLFAAAALSSRATLALSVIETATADMLTSRQGGAVRAEPIVVARKPLARGATVAANVLAHGTGALNIDACRVGETVETWPASRSFAPGISAGYTDGIAKGDTQATGPVPAGRWPTNVVLDDVAAAELDEQSGITTSPAGAVKGQRRRGGVMGTPDGNHVSNSGHGDTGGASRFFPVFRYQAKAPTRERPKYWRPSCNCETVKPWPDQSPQRATDASGSGADRSWSMSTSGSESTAGPPLQGTTSTIGTATSSTTTPETFSSSPSSSTSASTPAASFGATSGGSPAASVDSSSRSTPDIGTSRLRDGRSTVAADPATLSEWSEISVCENCGAPAVREAHSTVKPLELMRWLVRLVTPVDGIVLEPFAGSGTTLEAAVLEGMRCIGIEQESTYHPLIAERMARAGLVAL